MNTHPQHLLTLQALPAQTPLSASLLLDIHPKRTESSDLNRHLYTHVHRNITQNNQEMCYELN